MSETRNQPRRLNSTNRVSGQSGSVQSKVQLKPVSFQKKEFELISLAAIVLLAAVLSFAGLTNHLFWDDEANTATFARNFLKQGELTAWDGKNLIAYRNGAELNEDLINIYIPPLQYYVTAAFFFLFGQSTFVARLPFVIFGLLTFIFLYKFCKHFTGRSAIAALSCLILSVNVAFLLFIRNCRYYSLAAFFFVLLLSFFLDERTSRGSRIFSHIVISFSVFFLFLTNYFAALCAVLALPVLFFFIRRERVHKILLIANAFSCTVAMGIYTVLERNPFRVTMDNDGTYSLSHIVNKFFTFLVLHIKDLGLFEFFPIAIALVLPLPFVFRRLSHLKELSVKAIVIIICMLVFIIVVSATIPRSPIPGSLNNQALMDMRYLVPLIPIGTVATALCLNLLWQLSKYVCIPVVFFLVFTNILYFGFLPADINTPKTRGVQCTICKYLHEISNDYVTGTEKIVKLIKERPNSKFIRIRPGYMAYSPMFYLPDKVFCDQLNSSFKIADDKRELLPDYIFMGGASGQMDIMLVRVFQQEDSMAAEDASKLIKVTSLDMSRPEIPWHAFTQEESDAGNLITLKIVEIEKRKDI